MGIGIALGGLNDQLNKNREFDIQQQQQDFIQQQKQQATVVSAIDGLFSEMGNIAKATAESGKDPTALAQNPAWQAMVNQASILAQKSGLYTPEAIQARAQTMLARPAAVDDTSHTVVKIGADLTGEQYGTLEKKSGKITPIDPRTGQPKLSDSEVITPRQAAVANPPGVFPPPPRAPAQVAQIGTSDAPAPGVSPQPTPSDVAPPKTPQEAVARNITGEGYLATLPKEAQPIVKGIANYQIDPKSLSVKGGHREQLLAAALQYSGGQYDQKFYNSMNAAVKEFLAGGAQSPAGQITYGNVAIQHLGTVMDAVEKMKQVPGLLDKIAKSNTPIFSYAAEQLKNRAIRGTSEGQALAAFLDARERYSEEISRFYAGGPGAEGQRKRSIESLDSAYSTAELLSVVKAESELLNGKVNVLQDRWKTALAGPRLYDATIRSKIPDFPLIQDKTRVALEKINGAVSEGPTSGNVVNWNDYFGKK